jgi:hypothetical protein
MAAFGLALLQLEADDEAMEEDELQEVEWSGENSKQCWGEVCRRVRRERHDSKALR